MKVSCISLLFCAYCLIGGKAESVALPGVNSTIHWPHHGDRVMKTHYEYVDVPADTAIWDFSHAIETGDRHEMLWINLGDSVLVKIEEGAQSIYQLYDDSLFWNGYENALLCVRDSIAPIDALNVLATGCGVSSPLYFHGSYSGNHAVDMAGSQSILISQTGTLVLPNDTVGSVCCLTTVKDCLVRISENKIDLPIDNVADSLLRVVEVIHQWYSPMYRFPLAENVARGFYADNKLLQKTEKTYLCTTDEQEYALGRLYTPETMLRNGIGNDVNSSHGSVIGSNSSFADCVTVRQNSDRIDVSANGLGNGNELVSVLLCDVQGHVWHSHSGNTRDGYWQHEITTSALSPGYYLLQIMNEKETHVERIRIK